MIWRVCVHWDDLDQSRGLWMSGCQILGLTVARDAADEIAYGLHVAHHSISADTSDWG